MGASERLTGSGGAALVMLCYFVFTAGVVYDLAVQPPATGKVSDAHGNIKPQVFMTGKVNGQYIYEGLASGLLFLLGGAGVFAIDRSMDPKRVIRPFVRNALLFGGCVATLASLAALETFMRFKLPQFGRW